MKKKLPSYAKKIGKSASKKKLPSYARKIGPYANYVPNEDTGIGETMKEAVKDMAITLPQSATLEMGDDILNYASPGLGDRYQESVDEARDRSPIATSVSDILAPNPLSKLKMGGKLISKVLPEAATSAMYQYGESGEIDPLRTVIETAAGKSIQKVADTVMVGNRLKRRATSIGANRPSVTKRYSAKAGQGFEDEVILDEVGQLEKLGLFQPGVSDFDSNAIKFTQKKSLRDRALGPVLPPSEKELVKRLHKMNTSLNTKIDEVVNRNQFQFSEGMDSPVFKNMKSAMDDGVYTNRNSPDSVFEDIMDRLFVNGDSVDLTDINQVKKDLYQIIGDKKFQKIAQDNPDKFKAYRKAAKFLKEVVSDSVDDVNFKRMNSLYGVGKEMDQTLRSKIRGNFSDPAMSSSMAIGSPLYRAARVLEESKEKLMGLSSQGSETIQRSPKIQDYLRGVGAGLVPRVNPGREPQSFNNLPMQLIKTKLPRTVEGILENKEVLLAKVAQQMPEAFEQVKFVVEERPEDLEQMMPMVMKLVPHAFESDKYSRINGKILDPLMQQKARGDIMEDARLSNTEKINMIDQLNRTNELEDY